MATIKDYRIALRQKYGAYNYRIRCDRGIDVKTDKGWIFLGWLGEFEIEFALGFVE